MAPTEPATDAPLADSTGAKFEENKVPHKVIVTARPRVTKPEDTGSEAAEEIDTKTVEQAKTLTHAKPKASTLKPDKPETELEIDEPEEDTPELSDSADIGELAKAATDKKAPNQPGNDLVVGQKVQNLIANKTYFVPIGQVTKRRNTKIFVVILVLVVVACAGAYFMMTG